MKNNEVSYDEVMDQIEVYSTREASILEIIDIISPEEMDAIRNYFDTRPNPLNEYSKHDNPDGMIMDFVIYTVVDRLSHLDFAGAKNVMNCLSAIEK